MRLVERAGEAYGVAAEGRVPRQAAGADRLRQPLGLLRAQRSSGRCSQPLNQTSAGPQWDRGVLEQRQQPGQVVAVDVGQDEELEVRSAPAGMRSEMSRWIVSLVAWWRRRRSGSGAAPRVAVLDPDRVAVAGREELDGEEGCHGPTSQSASPKAVRVEHREHALARAGAGAA